MSVPTPPPTPSYGGAVPEWPFSPPEAIAWGWRKFRLFLGPVMIGVAIYIAFSVVTQMISGASSLTADLFSPTSSDNPFEKWDNPFTAGTHIVDFLIQIIVGIVSAIGGVILKAAAARAALDVADGRIYDFMNALRRIPIWKLIGANLLLALLGVVAALVVILMGVALGVLLHAPVPLLVVLALAAIVPFIAAALLVYLTPWVLVDAPDLPVLDAIRSSIRLVRANFANSLLLALLNILVSIAGFLACCVGLVVAYPVTMFAIADAFRRFQGRPVAA